MSMARLWRDQGKWVCPADPFIACSSNYGHGGVGSPVTSYRSQAARTAARSSRSTFGDLAGLPLLKSAPCSHFEQISTRGRDAASVAPICPQLGQTIRVSMSVTTAATGAAARGQASRSSSGSLPMLAAMRRALSRLSSLVAALAVSLDHLVGELLELYWHIEP
jgi:hypothetical protein